MQLCFFEDQQLQRFHPLTLTRPMDDLRIGIITLREKWELELSPVNTGRLLRSHLVGIFERGAIHDDPPCLWINSRYVPELTLLEKIGDLETGSCLQNGDSVIAARVDGATSSEWFSEGRADFNSLLVVETEYRSPLNRLWDLYLNNGNEISADIERLNPSGSDSSSISKHAVLENRDEIFIGSGARIEPGVILIADDGPIYIGEEAIIRAGSILRGPVAVGDRSIVKMGARIYDGVTVGPICKAAGEISNTIFHSYSNKAHEGYVGNSLIGQWCNIGADTNTSNLKNNYSPVAMYDWETMEAQPTDQQFIGTIMGDHSKTAINVQLNSGTVCGVSCNIFSSDFPPKIIPSFSWVGTNVIQPYRFDKALQTMSAVMKRRNVEVTKPYEKMMKYLSDQSRA